MQTTTSGASSRRCCSSRATSPARRRTLREPVDCNELSSAVADELRPVAEAKGVEVCIEDDGAGADFGRPDEIRRAIANLMANAIEATARGGHVAARASRDAGAGTR